MTEQYDPPLPWTGEVAAPLTLFRTTVRPQWIDEYEHVNIAHYLTICDHSNWAFWNWINGPEGTIEERQGHEYIIVENHVHYLDELALASPIHVTTQLLAFDSKRYVLFHRVYKSETDTLAATNEVKCLAFNLAERRSETWRPFVAKRLESIDEAHGGLDQPSQAGRGIALKSR